ncbi:MAG: hypothetical protein IPH35_02425 [Rhodoferax sp.]|nr:hypothetical protein [Rhodoferax sp.]
MLASDFTRGFVATGLLATFQDRAQRQFSANGQTFDGRRILRHALQGGIALAAGSVAAEALVRRNALRALIAVAAGATTVLTIEQTLRANAQQTPQEM